MKIEYQSDLEADIEASIASFSSRIGRDGVPEPENRQNRIFRKSNFTP